MLKKWTLLSLSYLLVLGLGLIGGVYLFDSKATGAIWTCPMHLEIRESEVGKCPLCGMNLVLESSLHHNHEVVESEAGQLWTCSMHPQIRQDKSGSCPLCGMDLIPIEGDNADETIILKMTPVAAELAHIQTSKVKLSTISTQATLTEGRLEADQTQIASLVTHIAGRIEQLFVSYTGEKVTQGQKIATIYAPDFITAQKELLEAAKIAQSTPELLQAAKNKLRFWKLPATAIENILKQGEVQEHISVYADYSGIVQNKHVAVGDYLKEGQPLFDLQNLTQLWAIFDLYESDLERVKLGDKITFTTPARPSKTFKAKIIFIEPTVNPKTRVATVRTAVENRSRLLKPGMFISGILQNESAAKYLRVPRSAVLWTGQRSVVYVKVPDRDLPSFEYREVILGLLHGQNYTILEGLEVGEEVVINGAFVIDAAAQFNNQNSMLNRKVSLKK